MTALPKTENTRLEKRIRTISLTLMILGGIPVLARFFGVGFVPSPTWVSWTFWPACVVGALSAALALWAIHLSLSEGIQLSEPIKTTLSIFFMPLVGAFAGFLVVAATIPMVVSLPSIHTVEITFVVSDPNMGDSRKCPRPIALKDTARAINVVCDVPNSIRRRLQTGRQIILVGPGSSVGVFPTHFRLP
ncbi:hypothetical protein [uncultured Ruegeria sp.]|uniref:hypothetical protein n=1 Tax=uncultured Ruegeria sp. TaxID=259304 RepID=UPI002632327B|nr:hypothetical protein [uncultured Ruegeria sp.]